MNGFPHPEVVVPQGPFRLLFHPPGVDTGDFERYELFYSSQHAPTAVRIDRDFTGWAYVTPDGRYLFTEPLYALNIRTWEQFPLHAVLGIENYTDIEAISRDQRRLLIARREFAIDNHSEPEYFELILPK